MNHVQPVPCPAFAVTRGWRAGDRPASRRRSATCRSETRRSRRRRREAREIDRQPADQRSSIGFRAWCEAVRQQFLKNEGIDGIPYPLLEGDGRCRDLGLLQGGQGPAIDTRSRRFAVYRRNLRPLIDPGPQRADLIRCQRITFWWHSGCIANGTNVLDERTFGDSFPPRPLRLTFRPCEYPRRCRAGGRYAVWLYRGTRNNAL